MKLLLENWRQYLTEGDDEFFGNCGMYAIALGEEALKNDKEVVMVVAHNADNPEDLIYGDVDVYHVAVEIDGTLYDAGGEVASVNELLNFIDSPYAKVDYFALDDIFKKMVRTQTNWSKTCEDYKEEAGEFVRGLEDRGSENK